MKLAWCGFVAWEGCVVAQVDECAGQVGGGVAVVDANVLPRPSFLRLGRDEFKLRLRPSRAGRKALGCWQVGVSLR